MISAKNIPTKVKRQVEEIVERFNREVLGGGKVQYVARFKGLYFFLDRKDPPFYEGGSIGRLEFTGDLTNWRFAIFKYSSNRYDPEECWFPGFDELDGTLESVLSAGLKAYPPEWAP
jgi:hypothetical protein